MEDRERALDLIQPGRMLRCEVQRPARVFLEPVENVVRSVAKLPASGTSHLSAAPRTQGLNRSRERCRVPPHGYARILIASGFVPSSPGSRTSATA